MIELGVLESRVCAFGLRSLGNHCERSEYSAWLVLAGVCCLQSTPMRYLVVRGMRSRPAGIASRVFKSAAACVGSYCWEPSLFFQNLKE